VDCPQCGGNYESDGIGAHWSLGSCDVPRFTRKQYEILIGSLMGDGWLDMSDKSPRLRLKGINKRYLRHVQQKFPLLMKNFSLVTTAQEAAHRNRKRNFSPQAEEKDYHDLYSVGTRNTPWLNELAKWYSSGKKRFDQNLTLSATIARHWYSGDGNLNMSRPFNGTGKGHCEIRSVNEEERSSNLLRMFSERGFDVSYSSHRIRFDVEETERFLDWIGPAPPGFPYKYEIQDPDRYKYLKDMAYGDL